MVTWFMHRWRRGGFSGLLGSIPRRIHRPARRLLGREPQEFEIAYHVVVDRFRPSVHEIGLVPETGRSRTLQKPLPPLTVRIGPCPPFLRGKVSPVLAHSDVRRGEGPQQVFVQQQSVGLSLDRLRDVRAEAEQGFESGQPADPHPQVNHDEVRIGGQIDGAPIDARGHARSSLPETMGEGARDSIGRLREGRLRIGQNV